MVENRPILSSDYSWQVNRWGITGKIDFDCDINQLDKECNGIKDFINNAKFLRADPKGIKLSGAETSIDRYLLAIELTRFFNNDVTFYKKDGLTEELGWNQRFDIDGDFVELAYKNLSIPVSIRNRRSVWEVDCEDDLYYDYTWKDDYTYTVERNEVIDLIDNIIGRAVRKKDYSNLSEAEKEYIENFYTSKVDEYDNETYNKLVDDFFDKNLEMLIGKYFKEILEYFEEDAIEANAEKARNSLIDDAWEHGVSI
jgi:hypothetical protein